jgi:hypothetical protein
MISDLKETTENEITALGYKLFSCDVREGDIMKKKF